METVGYRLLLQLPRYPACLFLFPLFLYQVQLCISRSTCLHHLQRTQVGWDVSHRFQSVMACTPVSTAKLASTPIGTAATTVATAAFASSWLGLVSFNTPVAGIFVGKERTVEAEHRSFRPTLERTQLLDLGSSSMAMFAVVLELKVSWAHTLVVVAA